MAAKPPIVFKSEPALWAMLAECNPDGRSAKPFDMRRWDQADDRIYRLAWGIYLNRPKMLGPIPSSPRISRFGEPTWVPDEKEVGFVNKVTGQLLTFEYLGVEFTPWAPGWGFLILGKRLSPPVEEE